MSEVPSRTWRFSAAPPPFPDEAPSSWVCRVAHAHRLTIEEIVALQGATASELDLGLAEGVLADVSRKGGGQPWPPPDPVVVGLSRLGRLPDFRPQVKAEEWWAYCPACIKKDLEGGAVPYIRACWAHPMALACRHHGLLLRSWPRGREVQLADSRTFFSGFTQDDLRSVEASPAERHWSNTLARPGTVDWEGLAVFSIDLADGMLARTGPQAQDRMALFQFAANDDAPRWGGSARLPRYGLVGLEAHVRLLVLRAIVKVLAFDPLKDAEIPSWLRACVQANARGAVRRTLVNVSADPLFLLMARLNPMRIPT